MKEKIQMQLSVIDSLLRDKAFCLSLARLQDTAYYTGIGKPVSPFLKPEEEDAIVQKSLKEEKIASSLAGFYAVESGIGRLCAQTQEKPSDWLQRISNGTADTTSILLLNRFANATWKAGQPFKDLNNISRPVFRSASFLPPEEIQKDYNQVRAASIKLLSSFEHLAGSSTGIQMQKIRDLLRSQSYAREMAEEMDHAYSDKKEKQHPFISIEEDIAMVGKLVKDQKIATNLAGFYAVECCTDYLVSTRHMVPSALLRSIVDDSIHPDDKDLYNRFANATWKACQPFRGLERIERESFTPFYFLKQDDIDKDWIQVKTAAKKLLEVL